MNSRGIPITISGTQLLLQNAELALRCPKGSCVYDKDYGSLLPLLQPQARENINALAFEYARVATAHLQGINVVSAEAALVGTVYRTKVIIEAKEERKEVELVSERNKGI